MSLRPLFAAILGGWLLACGSAETRGAATVLLVTDGNGTLTSNESSYKSYLESIGYLVTTVWDNASQATVDAAWGSANCVYVPYSVTDWELGDKLRLCTKGIVCEERYLDDNFGLSNTPGWDTSSYTAITITDNTHYITSPFSTGSLTIFTSSQPMTLMNPTYATGLQTLAEQHFGNKALTVVEAGATLANTVSGNSTAAGRRVHLPWGGDSFNIASLNTNAQTLGLRALEWAIGDTLQLHLKLNETSGTTAADSSIYGRNGTVTGTTSWIAGRRRNAFDFDGSTKIEVNSLLNSPTSFTVACWARVDVADSSGAEGVSVGDYIYLRPHQVTGGAPAAAFYRGSSNWVTLQASSSYVGRGWHHYAATFDDATNSFKFYIDGALVASTTTTYSISWSGLGTKTRVGQHGNTNTAFDLDGAVDDVRVYSEAKTQADVAAMYGLVGRWKLAETGGTTATDSSGVAANGTYTNGPMLTQAGPYPGLGQYAANFDGSNDYVNGPAATTYAFTDGFSIAGWMSLDTYVASSAMLQNGATTQNCELSITGTGQVKVAGRSAGGLQSLTTTTTLPVGKWKHVVGTYDGTTFKVYIDGVLDSSTSNAFTVAAASGNLTLGASLEGTDEFFDGKLQDVRLYNRALVADEVSELYGLVGQWKLAETSGTSAADSSGKALAGTYTGGVALAQTGPYPGAGQYAASFDGTNDYVAGPSASQYDLANGFAISGWVLVNGFADNGPVLECGSTTAAAFLGFSGTGQVRVAGTSASTSYSYTTTTTLPTKLWKHVVGTYDGATFRVYIDGQLDSSSSQSFTPAAPAGNLTVGASLAGAAEYLNGRLRDARLYNRPLSTAEIAELYGLVGYWNLDEGAGTTLADSSGAGGHAAFNAGSPTWIATAPYRNGLQFSGSNDAATSTTFTPPSVGTVAFWMRPNGAPASIQRMLGNGGDWEVRQYTDGIVYLDLCGDNPVSTNFTTVTLPTIANRWYHILGTFDSADDSYAVYVNGVLERSGTSVVNMVAQPASQLSIGTRTGAAEHFAGAIDDVRIYNRKMSPWEVYQVYGQMAWYKMDETSGSTATDSTTRGQDGAFSGSPTLNVAANGSGTQGTAVAFNGTNYMQAAGLYDKSPSVSAAGWVRLDGVDTAGADVVSLGDYFRLRLNSGASGASVSYFNGTSYVTATASQVILNTGWHHFAAVLRENDTLKLYVDGVEVASTAVSGSISYSGLGTNSRVASHGNGGTTTDLTGRIDDVRIYNRAMTPLEVYYQYRGTRINGLRILKWVEAR